MWRRRIGILIHSFLIVCRALVLSLNKQAINGLTILAFTSPLVSKRKATTQEADGVDAL